LRGEGHVLNSNWDGGYIAFMVVVGHKVYLGTSVAHSAKNIKVDLRKQLNLPPRLLWLIQAHGFRTREAWNPWPPGQRTPAQRTCRAPLVCEGCWSREAPRPHLWLSSSAWSHAYFLSHVSQLLLSPTQR
jgi:hypothetical protein